MERGYTGKQFVGLITPDIADRQVEQFYASEFGSLSRYLAEIYAAPTVIKGEFPA
jgi:hypothetical protein